jgi:DNA-binding NarL/FixJ family response regulator
MPMCEPVKPLRVLIVDDKLQVRASLRTLLSLLGTAEGRPLEIVGEAGNGMEAVEQSRSLQPEVVVMDLEMPQEDGYDATRAIKSVSPTTRVVAFTVHGDAESRRKAEQAGVDAYVEKGAPMSALLQAIYGLDKKSQGGFL